MDRSEEINSLLKINPEELITKSYGYLLVMEKILATATKPMHVLEYVGK